MQDSVWGRVSVPTHHSDKLVIQNEIDGTQILDSIIFCLFYHASHHLDPTLLGQNLKHGHYGLIEKGGTILMHVKLQISS